MIKTKNKTATIQFRVEPKLKARATKVFRDMGIDMSFALSTILKMMVESKKPIIQLITDKSFTEEFLKAVKK